MSDTIILHAHLDAFWQYTMSTCNMWQGTTLPPGSQPAHRDEPHQQCRCLPLLLHALGDVLIGMMLISGIKYYSSIRQV